MDKNKLYILVLPLFASPRGAYNERIRITETTITLSGTLPSNSHMNHYSYYELEQKVTSGLVNYVLIGVTYNPRTGYIKLQYELFKA